MINTEKILIEVGKKVEYANKKTAEEVVEILKRQSPQGRRTRKKYKDGWTISRNKKGNYIVHNETNYRLTHLLEKGHAKRGRKGRTRSFKHIQPVEEDLMNIWKKHYE